MKTQIVQGEGDEVKRKGRAERGVNAVGCSPDVSIFPRPVRDCLRVGGKEIAGSGFNYIFLA